MKSLWNRTARNAVAKRVDAWPARHCLFILLLVTVLFSVPAWPADIQLAGDWAIDVAMDQTRVTLRVRPPEAFTVIDERYESLPLFDPKPHPFGWNRGAALSGVRAAGCTTRHALDPASVAVRSAVGPDAIVFQRGRDYEMDDICGSIGRVPGSQITEGQPVWISYRFVKLRIDSIVLTRSGELALREGQPHIATPWPPTLEVGEVRLANLWLPGRAMQKLSADHVLPILETTYPEPPKPSPTAAERLLPRTLAKLRNGEVVKILVWGDSVTECGWLPDADRWQDQFVQRLKERFPGARIELIDQGWGGKNTELFLKAPPGNPHNYKEKILGSGPDLIVSEFINDVPLTPPQVHDRYSRLLTDFKTIGAEWIILTPHYCSPDGMGFPREREIDSDPRPYVKAIREFTALHDVALADASLRWGRLWRHGLPYSTLLSNTINHPDRRGMALFADSLLALFP